MAVITVAMTMPGFGIHQRDDGLKDFQSLPSSHEGEIDSDEEECSMEPQAEEDARNSGGLRNRKIKSSRGLRIRKIKSSHGLRIPMLNQVTTT